MALVNCRACKREISANAKSCPHCGEPAPATNEAAKPNAVASLIAFAVVGIAMFWCWGICGGGGGEREANRRAVESKPMTGDMAKLRTSSGQAVPVAASEEAHDRMTDLAVADDNVGLAELLATGQAAMTPAGTDCKVIETGVFTYEVRIMSGPLNGEAVFVSSDFVVSP